METDTFTANNGIVRHVFSMNSIPDHHAWGMSGKELQTELKILAGSLLVVVMDHSKLIFKLPLKILKSLND